MSMTGGASQEIELDAPETQAATKSGKLWAELSTHLSQGYLMGAGSPPGSDTSWDEHGIVQGHAYAILDWRAVSMSDRDTGRSKEVREEAWRRVQGI